MDKSTVIGLGLGWGLVALAIVLGGVGLVSLIAHIG